MRRNVVGKVYFVGNSLGTWYGILDTMKNTLSCEISLSLAIATKTSAKVQIFLLKVGDTKLTEVKLDCDVNGQ